MPEGLRVMGRNLSSRSGPSTPFNDSLSIPSSTPDGGLNLFQLPQFYWNHLSTTEPTLGGEPAMADMPVWEWDVNVTPGTTDAPLQPPSEWGGGSNGNGVVVTPGNTSDLRVANPAPPQTTGNPNAGFAVPNDWQSEFMGGAGASDQAAIYAALMSYMVEATKGS